MRNWSPLDPRNGTSTRSAVDHCPPSNCLSPRKKGHVPPPKTINLVYTCTRFGHHLCRPRNERKMTPPVQATKNASNNKSRVCVVTREHLLPDNPVDTNCTPSSSSDHEIHTSTPVTSVPKLQPDSRLTQRQDKRAPKHTYTLGMSLPFELQSVIEVTPYSNHRTIRDPTSPMSSRPSSLIS